MTDRLDRLEARVEHLEARLAEREAEGATSATGATTDFPDAFWLLRGLADRSAETAVVFGGGVELPGHGRVDWQYGRGSAELLEQPWDGLAAVLDALAHPVRLRLLQLIMTGVTTTAELAEQEDLGTTGQLHHHLRALIAAGWLRSPGRGRYDVVIERVVPLLTILLAADRT